MRGFREDDGFIIDMATRNRAAESPEAAPPQPEPAREPAAAQRPRQAAAPAAPPPAQTQPAPARELAAAPPEPPPRPPRRA